MLKYIFLMWIQNIKISKSELTHILTSILAKFTKTTGRPHLGKPFTPYFPCWARLERTTLNIQFPNLLTIESLRICKISPEPTRRYIFWPEGKKVEIFWIFRGNFPNPDPNQKWLTRPDLSNKKLIPPNPGQKNFTRTHHYEVVPQVIFMCVK